MRNKVGRRKCEMWISNNKVLIGGGMKKPHARNPNFETEETKLLISLWGDPKVQKTLITTHKKHPVIAKLADSMREHGYHRSPEEINTRIKNLKCFYNRIKKDIETGTTDIPTWRHYAAMDEILTRPIFGNRVQQPHLHNANTFKYSEDSEPKDLRPEDLLSVEEDFEDNDVDLDDGSIVPKEEPIDIDDMEEVDNDDIDRNDNEMDDVNDIFPKLSAYLQLASNSALKGAPTHPKSNSKTPPLLDIKNSPPSSPSELTATSTTMILTTSAISTNAAVSAVGSNSTTTTTTTAGNKISLVPTNILMKPTASPLSNQAQFSFKPHQFLCAKSASGTSTVYTTTNNGMPMKVLLVNTLQKPNNIAASAVAVAAAAATTSTVSVPTTSKSIISTPITTRPLVSIQPKPMTVQNNTHSVVQSTYQTRSATAANANAQATKPQTLLSSNKYLYSGGSHTDTATKRQVSFKQKSTPGFRSLLNQLVQLQSKQLEVSRQRLDVERERLEFEQSTGNKILTALTALLQNKVEARDEK